MAFYAMSKDFAVFKSGFAPFFMKTSKNCQAKNEYEKIESYDFGRVVVRRSQRPRWSCLPSCQKRDLFGIDRTWAPSFFP